MNKTKGVAALVFAAAMMMGLTTAAYAVTYDDPIDSVSLNFDYELASGMGTNDIDVTCDTDGVDSVTVSSIANTTYGKRPTVTLKIKAETGSGYYFSKDDAAELKTAGAFSLSGDVEYKSSKRVSNSQLQLVVRLPKIGGGDGEGLEIESAEWRDDTGVVEWASADEATKYTAKLLRGTSTKSTVSTENTWYDFSSVIRQYGTGTYTVKVKAYSGNYSGEWEETEEFEVTDENIGGLNGGGGSSSSGGSSSGGAWLRDANGWWYCNADRSYTTNNWQQIDGYWYYFNGYGYMVTGWFQSPASGLWYYLSEDQATLGRMVTNQYVGGYYVNGDGVWVQ